MTGLASPSSLRPSSGGSVVPRWFSCRKHASVGPVRPPARHPYRTPTSQGRRHQCADVDSRHRANVLSFRNHILEFEYGQRLRVIALESTKVPETDVIAPVP